MTFKTGNPIGSTDARDLSDNAENMDYLENSTTKLTHADRLGALRKTRHGMEVEHNNQIAAHESEHDAQISAHESEHDNQISAHKVEHDNQMQSFETDFDHRLAGMAFTRVGSFTSGATLTDMRQVLIWEVSQGGDGHEYGWNGAFPKVVAAGSTPATSGGIGAGAWVDRTDVTLRSEIPSMFDSSMLDYFSGVYGISLSSLGLWEAGESISIGEYRVYNNAVWTPISDATICGAIPSFGRFYMVAPDKKIYIENCGDISTSDDTTAIVNSIAAAKSANTNEVIVNYNLTTSSGKIAGAGDIYWRGSGSIDGLYGVFVESESDAEIDFFCKVDNLPAFSVATSPVVVIVGDSISALKPDALNTSQTLYELLVQKISQSFPNKNITFYNRAIGGQTIGNFNSTSSSNIDAPWYAVGTTWIDYISALKPDVVIMHFGMNHTTESTLPEFISVIAKLQSFTKVPDIVICTNMVPSRENTYETFGTIESQLNRELTAGVQRGVSAFKKLNLIDFNRQFHAVRDGYDIRNSSMENIALNIPAPVSAYVSEKITYSDFNFTLISYGTDKNAISNMFNRSTGNGAPFCIKTGPGYTDTVFITNRNQSDVATSTLWLKFFCGSQALGYNYDTVDTGLVIPAGPFTLNVSVRDNTITVSFGSGDPDKVFKYTKLIRNGGWFYPKYGYWWRDAEATIVDNLFLDIGVPKKVKKQITDSELFGFYNGSTGLKYPNGGNGVNHPSSLGVSKVFRALLDRCEFAPDSQYQSSQSTIVPITNFSNGFVANEAFGTTIRGIKNPDGTITIDGQVSNTASSLTKGAVICTLPAEIRPPSERWIASATCNSSTFEFAPGTVQYSPGGGTLNYLSGNVNIIGINFTFKV